MSQNYDVIHFEALGEEANHLAEDTKAAQAKGELPADLRYLIVPDTLQDWLAQHPDEVLPPLLTIKTHSRPPKEWLEGEKKSITPAAPVTTTWRLWPMWPTSPPCATTA